MLSSQANITGVRVRRRLPQREHHGREGVYGLDTLRAAMQGQWPLAGSDPLLMIDTGFIGGIGPRNASASVYRTGRSSATGARNERYGLRRRGRA
jgi:hypothetical protein